MSLPHPCAVPSPCLIPSGTNLRWSKAPSSRARSAVCRLSRAEASVEGGCSHGVICASSPQAKNRRQSSKNEVLGASLQRRPREEQDPGRCCKKRLDSRSSFGTPFCFQERFALEKPLSNLHAQTCSQARNRHGALCFPEPSRCLLHTHGAAPGSRAGPERSVKAPRCIHQQRCVLNPHPTPGQTELPCPLINDPSQKETSVFPLEGAHF